MKPARIVIIEPLDLLREGLISVINNQPDMIIVGEAGSVLQGIRVAIQTRPDILLLNLSLPDGNGLDVITRIRSSLPGMQTVALTAHRSEDLLFSAIEKGVRGYYLQNTPLDELLKALRVVYSGGAAFPPDVMLRIITEFNHQKRGNIHPLVQSLSSRELEVLCLLSNGASNREIGSQLGIVESTVKNHVHRILNKLELRNRREAFHFVREHGIRLYL
jgi:DNA-binding NarL/FixJ family response regulator